MAALIVGIAIVILGGCISGTWVILSFSTSGGRTGLPSNAITGGSPPPIKTMISESIEGDWEFISAKVLGNGRVKRCTIKDGFIGPFSDDNGNFYHEVIKAIDYNQAPAHLDMSTMHGICLASGNRLEIYLVPKTQPRPSQFPGGIVPKENEYLVLRRIRASKDE